MNEQATASHSPFIQGRNARLYGKSVKECPYPEGSQERQAWRQAHEEAAADTPDETAGRPRTRQAGGKRPARGRQEAETRPG